MRCKPRPDAIWPKLSDLTVAHLRCPEHDAEPCTKTLYHWTYEKTYMSARVKQELLCLGPKKTGLVFPGYKRGSGKADRSDPNKLLYNKVTALKTILKLAGIDPKGVGFHAFRHGFISAIEQIPGVPYSVVKALARHGDSPKDITARYLHPPEEQLRSALAKLEEKVFGSLPVEQAA
jgi:integrase